MTSSEHTGREAEIRARLDAATPGPWRYENGAELHGIGGDNVHYVSDATAIASDDPPLTSFNSREDAELVAHAPDDLAYLLGELDDAQRLFDALGSEAAEELKAAHATLTKLREQNVLLEGQLAKARERHVRERRYTCPDGEGTWGSAEECAADCNIPVESVEHFDICAHCGDMEVHDDEWRCYDWSQWPCADAADLGLGEGDSDER